MSIASAANAAGGGYGPTPPSNGAPGGFSTVVASQQIGPAGGSLSATVGGKTLTVTVPAGDFSTTVDLVITAPDLTAVQGALASLGYSGFTAVAGAGVDLLDTNGNKLTGSFPKPITVTISGSGLGVAGEKVLELTGPASATSLTPTLGSGSVTVGITSDPNLVVANPVAGSSVVPGATSQSTGKSFAGERDVAIGLGAVGLAVIGGGWARRRSVRLQAHD